MIISDKFIHPVDAREFSCLAHALSSDSLSGTSAIVTEYENVLAATFKSQFCIAINSGTAALHASLYVSGVGPGDEVIVSALAPIPTILPILAVGATPVFVDCASSADINYDLAALRAALTKNTKALIALPLWGYPLAMNALEDICAEHAIALIEDACQAHFTVHDGSVAGVGHRIGCFSTHDRKIISTGEGGFVLTQDEKTANSIRRFTRLGGMKGEFYGPNFKLSGIQAALGMARIGRAELNLKMRGDNAHFIKTRLDASRWFELTFDIGRPNYYCLVVFSKYGNPQLMQENLAQSGLRSDYLTYGSDQYRRPLFGNRAPLCSNASALIKQAITIPVHPGIDRLTCEKIIAILNNVEL